MSHQVYKLTKKEAAERKAAIQEAKELRAAGKTVKVMCESGVYCRPYAGLTPYRRYFVQEV